LEKEEISGVKRTQWIRGIRKQENSYLQIYLVEEVLEKLLPKRL
jgi:hypothetical protein